MGLKDRLSVRKIFKESVTRSGKGEYSYPQRRAKQSVSRCRIFAKHTKRRKGIKEEKSPRAEEGGRLYRLCRQAPRPNGCGEDETSPRKGIGYM